MKKIIISLILVTSVVSHAGIFDFFDFTKFFEAALTAGEGLAENLEKVRLKQQQVLDIREQWDQACEVTQTLNPSILAFNKLLTDYKINQELCAPVTTVIKLQSDILAHCEDFYSKPVPDNAEFLLGKFTISLLQSKMILTKCYPALANIKLPGFPGSN
ncbi:MAG: hypothetical protein ACXWQQ_01325 [Pseudobdellovibrio sp.]